MDIQQSIEETNKLNNKVESEIVERAVTALREGAKAVIAINGAAAVSILGFMGGVAGKMSTLESLKFPPLQGPLLVFALGVFVASISYLLLHQYEQRDLEIFRKARNNRAFDIGNQSNRWKGGAVALVVAGALLFCIGCAYTAYLL